MKLNSNSKGSLGLKKPSRDRVKKATEIKSKNASFTTTVYASAKREIGATCGEFIKIKHLPPL